jgi:hypothetical protein
MEDIINSITNGQYKQAVRLLKNSNYSLVKILDTVAEEDGVDTACGFLAICISQGYIQFHDDYED